MKINLRRSFSLVEVALGIAVLAAGSVAVVTLLPTGLKQKKDATGQNYSAIFINDSQAYFSSLAKNDFSTLESLPEASQVFENNTAQPGIVNAQRTKQVLPDLWETNKNGVYYLSKSSGNIEDYAGQLVVWKSDPISQDVNLTTKTVVSSPAFNITSGTISNTEPADYVMTAVGAEWPANVYFRVKVKEPNKAEYTIYPFGNGVAVTSASARYNMPNLPAGTTIVSEAYGTMGWTTYNTLSTSTTRCKTLKNGDAVPTDVPFSGQKALATLAAPYLNDDATKISLADNQAIYCFEVDYVQRDFQDLVIVTNITPTITSNVQSSESGIAISPTGNDYAFELTNDAGVVFNRNSMQANKQNSAYNSPGQFFDAKNLRMKTKGNDTVQLNVEGLAEPLDLAGKDITIASSSNTGIRVRIWKENSGMGKWYLQIVSANGTIVDNDNPTTPLINAGGTQTQTTSIGIGVNAEISWPLSQKDYSKREKVRYYTEYYNMPAIQ